MKETINKTSNEIYSLLGEGYGFNGSKEDAVKLLEEKITDLVIKYADKAFTAGRSKTPWKVFYVNNFLIHKAHEEALIEAGLLCDGKEYCQCAKDAMSRGANRDIVESYERNCPNQPY